MRAIEVPWTYHFEASESPVVIGGQPFFVDALDMVCGLAASIIKQAQDYFGEFTAGRMRCIEPAYRFQFDKKAEGRWRYSYTGVALIEADFNPNSKRKVQMSNEAAIEKEIQAKGLNAPRLTPEMIDAQIRSEHYVFGSGLDFTVEPDGWSPHASLSCLTICVLVLRNGFTVVGKSACASPENFNAELGQKIAREDARRQIWALEGYQLRSMLANLIAPRDPVPEGAVFGAGQAGSATAA